MDKLVVGCGYIGSRGRAHYGSNGASASSPPPASRSTPTSSASKASSRSSATSPIPPASATCRRCRTVFHGVGLDRSAGQSMRQVYVDGLRNVLEALPRPGRFIYISSTSVYGQSDGEEVDESAPTAPQEESGQDLPGSRTAAARLPARGHHPALRRHLRPGPTAAPTGHRKRRADPRRPRPLAEPDPRRRWRRRRAGRGGTRSTGAIYNVSDGHPVRRRDFFVALAKRFGSTGAALRRAASKARRTNAAIAASAIGG